MPASNYGVIEPSVHIGQPALWKGQGGSGDFLRLKSTKAADSYTATGPASLIVHGSHALSTFTPGCNGTDNVHSERAIFSFDEELERDLHRAAPVYHSGTGNMIYLEDSRSSCTLSRKDLAASSAANSSSGSAANRALNIACGSEEKAWCKLKGTT